MRDEVEYLLRLRDSQFVKRTFKKNVWATKTDFEKICGLKSRNNEFRKWINYLIEQGSIEKISEDYRGDLFVVNSSKIRDRLMTLPLYRLFGKYYEDFLP